MNPKKQNPFLKKASGAKPPTRRELKHGLGSRGVGLLLNPADAPAAPVAAPSPAVAALKAKIASAPAAATAPAVGTVLEVPPMDIERCPWQPRADFNEEALRELADSIRANGIIQPLVCRRNAKGRYELIAGERRLRASVMAGLAKVKIVLVDADDRKSAEMAVIENIQRRDLNVIEEAEGYRLLQEKFDLTQESVSERVGKSRPAIANALRLLELPDEVKQLLSQNLISTGHAKVLLSEDDEKMRVLDARAVVNEGLTVRALEARLAKRVAPPVERKAATPDMPDGYVRTLTDALRRHFGCAVRLTASATQANGRRTKGVLELDFVDNDDLDRVLNVLGVKVDA